MKMKKFTAETMPEVMKKVRAELGDDAVIISQRVIKKKKLLGLMSTKTFEVTAGIDHVTEVPTAAPAKGSLPTAIIKTESSKKQTSPAPVDNTESLRSELADVKAMLHELTRQQQQQQYPKELTAFLTMLKKQELDEELITVIGDELFEQIEKKTLPKTRIALEQATTKILRAKLQHLPIGGFNESKKFIHLLGPTGVGKTTTIAKIAARTALEKKKKVAFMTTDTYRIAAIEQLKTYAGLLQAPVEVVYSLTDYEQAMDNLKRQDVVFVDTAGRNYKEQRHVEEITKLLNFNDEMETYIVLSSTAKEQDLCDVIDQFMNVPFEKFLFTKLDETNSIGTMINLMVKYNKGLSYYTSGQEVPEDIEEASLDRLIALLFQGDHE
ncbi:MAG: flagellar biosynthesis protein FlhF [Caryophanon sp.]|nr:flagellar biosynthesis protein FlhF [Caryophanon sp.]